MSAEAIHTAATPPASLSDALWPALRALSRVLAVTLCACRGLARARRRRQVPAPRLVTLVHKSAGPSCPPRPVAGGDWRVFSSRRAKSVLKSFLARDVLKFAESPAFSRIF